MKHFVALCILLVCVLCLSDTSAIAQQNSNSNASSNTSGAEKRTQDILPAQPPKESSGTVHGSGLKPSDGHKSHTYKPVPSPKPDKTKKKTDNK